MAHKFHGTWVLLFCLYGMNVMGGNSPSTVSGQATAATASAASPISASIAGSEELRKAITGDISSLASPAAAPAAVAKLATDIAHRAAGDAKKAAATTAAADVQRLLEQETKRLSEAASAAGLLSPLASPAAPARVKSPSPGMPLSPANTIIPGLTLGDLPAAQESASVLSASSAAPQQGRLARLKNWLQGTQEPSSPAKEKAPTLSASIHSGVQGVREGVLAAENVRKTIDEKAEQALFESKKWRAFLKRSFPAGGLATFGMVTMYKSVSLISAGCADISNSYTTKNDKKAEQLCKRGWFKIKVGTCGLIASVGAFGGAWYIYNLPINPPQPLSPKSPPPPPAEDSSI